MAVPPKKTLEVPKAKRPVREWSDEEVLAEFHSNSELNAVRKEVTAGMQRILGPRVSWSPSVETRRIEFEVAESLLHIARQGYVKG